MTLFLLSLLNICLFLVCFFSKPESLQIICLFLCITAISSSFLVFLTNNPVTSLFFLISTFLNVSLLLLTLKLEFLALIFSLIYLGAIAIFFLFVIMLLNLKQLDPRRETSSFKIFEIFTIFSLIIQFILFVKYFFFNTMVHFEFFNIYQTQRLLTYFFNLYDLIGQFFFTFYGFAFILLGFLLLIIMIGVIVITTEPLQPDYDVVLFDFGNTISKKKRTSTTIYLVPNN